MSYELSKAPTPQQVRYYLKMKIMVKEVTYDDEQSTGVKQTTEKLVFMIPQQSTQMTKFFMAWLPDTAEEAQELGFEIAHPVFLLFRGALWRRTQHVDEYHVLVMSRGAEEELKRFDGKTLDVEVLAEGEDTLLDQQRNYELPYKKKSYEETT